MLTYHGKSKEVCEWVIATFKNDLASKDNLTVQLWIKASEDRLKELL